MKRQAGYSLAELMIVTTVLVGVTGTLAAVGHSLHRTDRVSAAYVDDITDLRRAVRMVERHPLGSQAFVPLGPTPFLLLVAPPGDTVGPDDLRAFRTAPGQGVNYARGTWHHPLIAIETVSPFLVIDRIGDDENCDEIRFDKTEIILEA